MGKRIVTYILLLLLGQHTATAQDVNRLMERDSNAGNNGLIDRDSDLLPGDSTGQEIDVNSVPIELRMWKVDERLGDRQAVPVDTLHHHFQNSNLTDGPNGEYNYLGNLGAPRESRIFFNRPSPTQFLFLDPYSAFVRTPGQALFTNTKSPFTNLTYHKAGSKRTGEDRFKTYFAVNVNKRLGLGFSFDYLYGRGMYASQSTAFFNGSLFGSYVGDRYELHAVLSFDKLKMGENGGIVDDRYITNPLDMAGGKKQYQTTDILTRLNSTWNRNKGFDLFLTHRYNIGFEKETADEGEEAGFVPVSSIIHTVRVRNYERKLISYESGAGLYANDYFGRDSVSDITRTLSVKNTVGISIREGFSSWAKAGLTGFVTHEYRYFTLPDTMAGQRQAQLFQRGYRENVLSVGGEFAKRQGRLLHYNVTGELAIAGEDAGQFNIDGKLDLNFRLSSDTVRLDAHAYVKSLHPGFYYRHYQSAYYWWDNSSLSKEYRTRIEGQLSIDRWRTRLSAGVENVKNYTYFANADKATTLDGTTAYLNDVTARQATGNIQVFSATLKQDFRLGILHLDNEVTYQKSSDNTVLPLPELNLYHNLYLSAKLAKKVLSIELGADVRYFTRYHAPCYSPVIGQFYQQNPQDLTEIGGYPLVNVYANLHLKRTRLYVMMYHVNKGLSAPNYFLAPHYPENPRMFKFGISWNFFD